MSKQVVVYRAMVNVKVTIPDGVSDDEFDDTMESKYESIGDKVDLRDAVQIRLTDVGGPLNGYDVQVEVV